MTDKPTAADKRVDGLTDDHETAHAYALLDSTSEGTYAPVLRTWDHPSAEGATIISERYAYLTDGDGRDGWVENGINRRFSSDDPEEIADACYQIAQMYLCAADRLRNDRADDLPNSRDVRPEADR